MKISPLLLAVSVLAVSSLPAQENAAPAAAQKPLQLAPEPAPSNFLIPDTIQETSKPRGLANPGQPSSKPSKKTSSTPSTKTNKTAAAEADVQGRIQYRLAKNKAVRDPAVQAALEAAEKAKTDLEKRDAMKRYYSLLNARILKIDNSLSKTATERQTYSTHRLEQTRIDPTEPLDPDQRTERQGRD